MHPIIWLVLLIIVNVMGSLATYGMLNAILGD